MWFAAGHNCASCDHLHESVGEIIFRLCCHGDAIFLHGDFGSPNDPNLKHGRL